MNEDQMTTAQLLELIEGLRRRLQAAESRLEALSAETAVSATDQALEASLYKLVIPLITSDSTFTNLAAAILDLSKQATDSEHGYVSVVDPETGDNIAYTLTEMMGTSCLVQDDDRRIKFPRGPDGKYPGLWGHALNTGVPFYTNSPFSHPAARRTPDGHVPLKNFLSYPVMLQDLLVGQIALANATRDYTERDIEVIGHLAEVYALAIHRKRFEEELHTSEARFRNIFDAAPVSIWEEDLSAVRELLDELRSSGVSDIRAHLAIHPEMVIRAASLVRIVDVNAASLVQYGVRTKEELLGSVDRLFTPRSLNTMVEILSQIAEGQTQIVVETENRTLDGRVIDVLLRLDLPPTAAEWERILVSTVDITALKRAERNLIESEETFRSLAEQSPNMIFINQWGHVVFANRRCEELMGYRREEFYSPDFDFMTLMAPDSRDIVQMAYARHGLGEDITPYEYRLLTKDGRRIEAIITTKIITYMGESAILGIVTDITEWKRSEQALRESEERLRLHFEQTPVGVIEWDLGFRIIKWNPAAQHIFGYTAAEVLGRHASFIVAESARQHVDAIWHDLLARRGGTRSTNENVTKDGRIILCEWYNTPLVDQHGQVIGVASLVEDVTHRKRLEEETQKAQKLESLGILAGGIAHDFNNILTGILGNISLARAEAREGDPSLSWLEQAEQAAIHAQALTRQLLTFSRGGTPVRRAIAIEPIVRNAIGFALSGSNVRCEYRIDQGLWPVEADEGQLVQVFNNLVINATQAMPQGGYIVLEACNDTLREEETIPLDKGDYVRITLADQGIGIPAPHLPKIFDPYFSTKQKGSGLGLTVVYSVIKNHGGHIMVDSEQGVGTKVTILLPASRQPLGKEPVVPPSRVKGQGRILLMDDEEIVRKVGSAILKKLGYDVAFASDGMEAVDLYMKARDEGQPFAAVIMDLTVPGGLGGKEAMKYLREIDPKAKVIVSSGYSNDAVMAHYRDYGFSAVLTKPYKVDQLHEILQRLQTTEGEETS